MQRARLPLTWSLQTNLLHLVFLIVERITIYIDSLLCQEMYLITYISFTPEVLLMYESAISGSLLKPACEVSYRHANSLVTICLCICACIDPTAGNQVPIINTDPLYERRRPDGLSALPERLNYTACTRKYGGGGGGRYQLLTRSNYICQLGIILCWGYTPPRLNA